MQGLMQDWPLTVDRILTHAAGWHGDREIVSRSVEGPIVRTTYAALHERAYRVSRVLKGFGIQPGDRVATLAWNTSRHMELWFGVMGMGAICHTLNPRLFTDQLCYIINHARDRLLFVDLTFAPLVSSIRARIPCVEQIVVLADRAQMSEAHLPGALCYEDLIETGGPEVVWGDFSEEAACGLCYTSGTTGNPKGVLYSHRSNFLHTLVNLQADALGLVEQDIVLPIVPMFHANAWGLAFAAPAAGAKMVLPGSRADGAPIHELLETEGVTVAAAVPTVWQMLLQYLLATGGRLTTLKRVLVGGSAVPESVVRGFQDGYGVKVTQLWGMTETSPVATHCAPTHKVAAFGAEDRLRWNLKQGRPPLGVDLKLTNDAGDRLPRDGVACGHLKVRGPYVVHSYYGADNKALLDDQGFFDTGDIATIDALGFVQITDRAKDVIKSGGEWISSIDIENIASGHPKAALAAVIGAPHPKWDERPLLLVKLENGTDATAEEFREYLVGKIPKWWMPDEIRFVEEIDLGATGKIDKIALRLRYL